MAVSGKSKKNLLLKCLGQLQKPSEKLSIIFNS